jgi:DNA-binding NarL/FixJ family response regulator
VLVADDCPDFLELLITELGGHFTIDGAVPNGRRLVERALARRPDVIVSDINMPVLGGIGALTALKDRGLDTPFVMVSSDMDAARECLALGAAAFVFKRDVFAELVPAVEAALAGRLYVSSSVRAWHSGRAALPPKPAGRK